MPVLGKVGLVNKGVYAAGTTYSALDFVKYNGSTFIALKSVKGVTPADDGTNWQYLARGAELALQNNLLTTQANTYALDAAQGPVIKAAIDSLNTELANRTVDQTAGNTLTIDTSMTGVRVSSSETDFVVLLPFIAKNRNYSVNLTFFSITNIGSSALSKATVTDKRLTTFRIQYAGDVSIPLANGTFTITFA